MESQRFRVLLVEDDRDDGVLLQRVLGLATDKNLDLQRVARLGAAQCCLLDREFDVVVLDLHVADAQGVESCLALQPHQPAVPVLVLSESHDDRVALEAMRSGAQDCLAKSDVDARALLRSLSSAIARNQPQHNVNQENRGQDNSSHPRWDRVLRELSMGPLLIKRFLQPAPNQELILATFDEQGWPRKVDDPLPPHPELVSKQRLRATIRSLNLRQRHDLIQFFGDGTGTAIRWQLKSRANKTGSGVI